jgi:hypothetical protein
MTFMSEARRIPNERSASHTWEYRLIFAGTFVAMLVSAAFSRVSASRRRRNKDAVAYKSIFHEAKAKTDQAAPFVFMG